MHETIERMIEKSMKVIEGKVMYDGNMIQEINKIGVNLHFMNEGVKYTFVLAPQQ